MRGSKFNRKNNRKSRKNPGKIIEQNKSFKKSRNLNFKEPNLGSGSSGSFLITGSAGSGSKTVRFPVPSSVLGLPEDTRLDSTTQEQPWPEETDEEEEATKFRFDRLEAVIEEALKTAANEEKRNHKRSVERLERGSFVSLDNSDNDNSEFMQ